MMAVAMAAAMTVMIMMMMMAVMTRMPSLVVVVVALSDATGRIAGAKLPRPPAQPPSPR